MTETPEEAAERAALSAMPVEHRRGMGPHNVGECRVYFDGSCDCGVAAKMGDLVRAVRTSERARLMAKAGPLTMTAEREGELRAFVTETGDAIRERYQHSYDEDRVLLAELDAQRSLVGALREELEAVKSGFHERCIVRAEAAESALRAATERAEKAERERDKAEAREDGVRRDASEMHTILRAKLAAIEAKHARLVAAVEREVLRNALDEESYPRVRAALAETAGEPGKDGGESHVVARARVVGAAMQRPAPSDGRVSLIFPEGTDVQPGDVLVKPDLSLRELCTDLERSLAAHEKCGRDHAVCGVSLTLPEAARVLAYLRKLETP